MNKFPHAAFVVAALGLSGCMDLITGGPLITPGTPTGTIVFENATSGTLDVVVMSTCSAGSYGLNRLPGDAVIPAGKTYSFEVSAGCWDVGAGSIGASQQALQRISVAPGGTTRYTITDKD